MIDISVIIVNYRGWSHLNRCLEAFNSFQFKLFSFEVIVVDNCSNDGFLADFENRFSNVKFLLNSGNFGFSHGCNLGARYAEGTYLLFLNPDIVATEDSISKLYELIRSSTDVSILSCKQVNSNGKIEQQIRFFPSYFTLNGLFRSFYRMTRKKVSDEFKPDKRAFIYSDWVSGSVLLISRNHFNEIEGWDERYWLYYEDVDLCYRSSLSGGKIAVCDSVSVLHHHGGTTRINPATRALTKSEVVISLHVFISAHYSFFKAFVLHASVIFNSLIIQFFPATLGVIFFFVRRLNQYSHIYFKLLNYYLKAIVNQTWISPRSVLYKK